MKLQAGHKIALFLATSIAAVVLCTLPFLVIKKEVIYIYTQNDNPTSEENGFITELKKSGFKVMLNSSSMPEEDAYGLWFKTPEQSSAIEKSPAQLNFLYTDAYYPIEWKNTSKHPIMLTPYQLLFEHYMRSNIKSAKMSIGVNTADYYPVSANKKYEVIYYGDNNQNIPIANMLQNRNDVKFLGSYWEKVEKVIEPNEEEHLTTNAFLSSSKIVIVYHQPDSSEAKRIPEDVMQATAAGALVFSSPNEEIINIYRDNVIIYENNDDLAQKLDYYLRDYDKQQDKILTAQKITVTKYSSQATSHRFQELLAWLKENQKISTND